jgi:hypothetical protein
VVTAGLAATLHVLLAAGGMRRGCGLGEVGGGGDLRAAPFGLVLVNLALALF